MSKLNVTAVINDTSPPQWIADSLARIAAHDGITLQNILLQELPANTPRHPVPSGLLERLAESVLYLLVDRSKPKHNVQQPTALSDELLSRVCEAGHTTAKQQTDLIIHFGDAARDTELLPVATHGIWTFNTATLKPHIEHALLTRAPLLWIHLWQIPHGQSDNPAPADTIRIGSHALPTQSFSISAMLNYSFASLPEILCSRLNWMAHGKNPQHYEQRQINSLQTAYSLPETDSYNQVSGVSYFVKAWTLFGKLIWRRFTGKRSVEQWHLGFKKRLTHATDEAVDNYIPLRPKANHRWWADPQVLEENGETHVFFEDMNLDDMVGKISTAVLTENGFKDEPVIALDEPHHLSYPFVFRHQDAIFMIPETASRRTVSLYKASKFPQEWTLVKTLFDDLDAADTTVFQHEGRWWMFTNGMSHPEVDERDLLWLYYTDDFDAAEWQPHPLNPVVTGVDRARMAGKVYSENGHLFRPGQYGAVRYGHGVNLSKITRLTTEDYEEELVSRMCPTAKDDWLGCHTAVHSNEFTIIDMLRRTNRN